MTNNETYSKMMAEMGEATKEYIESMTAILEYVTGKTIAELEKEMAANEEMTDVVTGAHLVTLTVTRNRLSEAAK